jgi:hypothetical protein
MALTEITQPRSAEQIPAWSRASVDPELRTAVGELPGARELPQSADLVVSRDH